MSRQIKAEFNSLYEIEHRKWRLKNGENNLNTETETASNLLFIKRIQETGEASITKKNRSGMCVNDSFIVDFLI